MTPLLAIDPGTTHSAWVVWDGTVLAHGYETNEDLLARLERFDGWHAVSTLVIERMASYGMAVGESVFATVFWSGRFVQAWHPRPWRQVYRRDVKLELCGSSRAKDPNVRAALIDRVGPQGKKAAKGPTYGISGDEWAALGVAVTACAMNGHGLVVVEEAR